MAIQKRFIHFKKFSDFNSKKLSANEANTQYTVGVSGVIQDGEPDVLYQSYCWIKDTKQQWTHGQLYDGTNSSVTESTINSWGFLSGKETSDELDDVETNTYVKYVAQTLTDEQKNQVRENLGIPSVDYIISLFEELKTLINNNSASDAIAVLDKAILDMHKLQ